MDWIPWISVLISVFATNVLLCMVQYAGRWGIMCAWIPGRVMLLLIQLHIMHEHHDFEIIEYTWASTLLSVVFLCVIHGALRWKSYGRMLRWSYPYGFWGGTWSVAAVSLAGVGTGIWYFKHQGLSVGLLCCGFAAAVANVWNVIDAPIYHATQPKPSLWYYFIVNIFVLAVLLLITWLTIRGEYLVAGILSNMPVFGIVLLARTSISNLVDMTLQHVYVLSFQVYPSLALTGVFWAMYQWSEMFWISFGIGVYCMLFIVCVQYQAVKARLQS